MFLKERTTQKSSVDTYRKSFLSLKTGLVRNEQWIIYIHGQCLLGRANVSSQGKG